MMGSWRAGRHRFIAITVTLQAAIDCVRLDEQCRFRKKQTILEGCRRCAKIGDASRLVRKTREGPRRFSKILRHPAADMARAPLM
jgi:hypothetical protein